jgi:cobalt-zinc-cadmium efflux system outer membrane protein
LLELNQLRGRPAADPLRVISTDPVLPELPALEALLNTAYTNNFDLRAREKEMQQTGERLELARHERKPGLSAGPMISEERAGGTERIVGIGVSMPLPLWNQNKGNIELAKARQLQAETSLVVARRELERKITTAYGGYQIKRRELAKWQNDSVAKFQESASLADRHYRLGAVPATTYVELQKQYLEAVTGLLDTKREALEAVLQLEALTGVTFIAPEKEVVP